MEIPVLREERSVFTKVNLRKRKGTEKEPMFGRKKQLRKRKKGIPEENAEQEKNQAQEDPISQEDEMPSIEKIDQLNGYWLVENFDTRSVLLKLPSKKEIHIDETSIHSTIGFPMGGESVMKKNGEKSEEAREVMRAWKLQFPVQKGTVRIADDVIKAFASATKNLAEAISTFDEKLRAAVQVLPDDEAMKMLVERVYSLLDGYSKENVQEEEKESTREGEKEWTFSQDDEYWKSEEVMKAIDAIEKAQKRRQEREHTDDVGGVTEHAEKERDWVEADVGGVIEENVGDGGQVTEAIEVVGDVEHVTEPTHTENGELQADVRGGGDVADVANVKKVPSEDRILDMVVEKNNREVEQNKKGNQDKCPERIAKRQKGKKRDVALSAALRSPFMNRIVDIRSTLTIEERMVEAFTFSADSDDNVLYKEGDRAIKKGHFQSLKLNSAVSFEIIDLWTDILNHKEKFKSNDSSAKVFFPTKICEKLMQKLRTRYLNEMLTFEKNEMKEEVVKKIKSGLIAQREIKKAAKGK
ncbi:unnamed protein product [Cuscuta campestris]|uniref:Uncharacterized protein n=1 Tax=Cuscuta campestris TaxID=132261 RepID=A0A484KKH5_9ASTE|nr:unnamed protein product [Cuscuta campestris]